MTASKPPQTRAGTQQEREQCLGSTSSSAPTAPTTSAAPSTSTAGSASTTTVEDRRTRDARAVAPSPPRVGPPLDREPVWEDLPELARRYKRSVFPVEEPPEDEDSHPVGGSPEEAVAGLVLVSGGLQRRLGVVSTRSLRSRLNHRTGVRRRPPVGEPEGRRLLSPEERPRRWCRNQAEGGWYWFRAGSSVGLRWFRHARCARGPTTGWRPPRIWTGGRVPMSHPPAHVKRTRRRRVMAALTCGQLTFFDGVTGEHLELGRVHDRAAVGGGLAVGVVERVVVLLTGVAGIPGALVLQRHEPHRGGLDAVLAAHLERAQGEVRRDRPRRTPGKASGARGVDPRPRGASATCSSPCRRSMPNWRSAVNRDPESGSSSTLPSSGSSVSAVGAGLR